MRVAARGQRWRAGKWSGGLFEIMEGIIQSNCSAPKRFLRGAFIGLAVWGCSQVVGRAEINLPKEEPISGYGLINAFPGVTFDEPVVITAPRGETNVLYVAERKGRIIVIPDLRKPQPKVFLDIVAATSSGGVETGLLGLAFHPDYQSNGRFFVFRTLHQPGVFLNLLSEFKRDTVDPLKAIPASEAVIISQADAMDHHNAGDIHFGPDGYLYLSVGDSGPAGQNIFKELQTIDQGLFGGILRIDVDLRQENLEPNAHSAATRLYRIPKDNPFIGITEFNGRAVDPKEVRTEFFAIGMRNPWRFTFDPNNGQLICADVGNGDVEEVNIIEKGGNYGWPFYEGIYWGWWLPTTLTPPRETRLPIYSYLHGSGAYQGRVVIGGVVYRGTKLPELGGRYLFGDMATGNIWALNANEASPVPQWLFARAGFSTFGIDPRDGEVLVADYYKGEINKLVYRPPEDSGLPRYLSEVNAFSSLQTLDAPNSRQFQIITPLWSDGARKTRWMNMEKADGLVGFKEEESWDIPAGAIFFKHFELELTNGVPESRKRIETRFLVKGTNGLYGVSYRWGDSTNDAELVPPEGMEETFHVKNGEQTRSQRWVYPGREQCNGCHTKAGGEVLAFNTYQLNRTVTRDGNETNQLDWMRARDFFRNGDAIESAKLPKFSSLSDPVAPLQHKVRSYLSSNCVQCHQPSGITRTLWDARISTPLKFANVVDAPTFTAGDPYKIIAAGDIANSLIHYRTSATAPYEYARMPPLGTTVADQLFLQTLSDWIVTIPEKKWRAVDIGAARMEGSAEQAGSSFRISSVGGGIEDDSYFMLSRTLSGTAEFGAKIGEFNKSAEEQAGIIIKENEAPGSPYAALYVQGSKLLFRAREESSGESRVVATLSSRLVSWLKLTRADGNVTASYMTGEGAWTTIGSAAVEPGNDPVGGFFVATREPPANFASARFTDYFLHQVSISDSVFRRVILPGVVDLAVTASIEPLTNKTITYRAADMDLGTVQDPWTFTWTNLTAGTVPLRAIINSPSGMLTSAPVSLTFYEPYGGVWSLGTDQTTLGNWRGKYGEQSVLIPGALTNLAAGIHVMLGTGSLAFFEYSSNVAALQENGTDRVASVYRGDPNIELTFVAEDHDVHQVALYFADWLQLGAVQTVTLEEPYGAAVSVEVNGDPGSYLKFAFRKSVKVRIHNPGGAAYISGIFGDSLGSTPVLESYLDGVTLHLKILMPTGTREEEIALEVSTNMESWVADPSVEFAQGTTDLREFTASKRMDETGAQFFRVRVQR